jgi:hypothetical protein
MLKSNLNPNPLKAEAGVFAAYFKAKEVERVKSILSSTSCLLMAKLVSKSELTFPKT